MPTEISTGSSVAGFQVESLLGEGAMMGGLQSIDECRSISVELKRISARRRVNSACSTAETPSAVVSDIDTRHRGWDCCALSGHK
jgi:hypothetical protein